MNAMIKSQVVRWHWWIAIEGARLCRSESGQEDSAGSKRRGRIFLHMVWPKDIKPSQAMRTSPKVC
ncbi:hypothetical protein B0H17DRAFT_1092109, partial [Mycena rosella]